MKSVTFSQLLAIISIGLLSCTFQTNAKEYYKWVDAKGVTTYSATPPPTQKQEPQLDPVKKNLNPTAATTTPASTNPHSGITQDIKATNTVTNITQSVKTPTPTAPNQTLTSTASTEKVFTVKSCNGVRCWDAKGKHYNLIAGNNYLSANGGKCQKTGNNMRCNK